MGSIESWYARIGLALTVAILMSGVSVAAEGAIAYVGSQVCQPCHAAEHRAWTGSHHDRAMEEATEQTVLGRFDDTEFSFGTTQARFFRRDGGYFVHTADPEGTPADFAVRYTFGFDPLQQLLLELPRGRMQAFTVAWDARAKDAGGERWYPLAPDEPMPAGDVMHWTGAAHNWNSMCATCHSTGFRKEYDAAGDRFASTWTEIDVACEACHGPGAQHVAWEQSDDKAPIANRGLSVDLRGDGATWTMRSETGIAERSKPRSSEAELNSCAPCHSRRSQIVADPQPGAAFLDSYIPVLIEDGLYYPDGQIRDEVFEWGSFVQSAMYEKGVTCGDCHDPHSLDLRGSTATVCLQCHDAAKFATKAHHGHEPASHGSACVDCHMPETVYMGIDGRRDHSFRVPRPDLSAALGVPNPCQSCHADQSPAWAESHIESWRTGEASSKPHFAAALARAWSGEAEDGTELAAIVENEAEPAIVRASALAAMASTPNVISSAVVVTGARSEAPLVRMAAARAAEFLRPQGRLDAIGHLLRDPVRAVRIEAGRVLAPLATSELPTQQTHALARAVKEFRAAQIAHAERPTAWVNLGDIALATNDTSRAERSYRRALAVGSYFVPGYVNLADLYRILGREAEGEAVLREGIVQHPDEADLRYALGLLLVRTGRLPAALRELRQAAASAPTNARYAYVYGVGLHSAGKSVEAIASLTAATERNLRDRSLLELLIGIHLERGERAEAAAFEQRLRELQKNP